MRKWNASAVRRRLVTVFVADYYSFIYLFSVSTIWADESVLSGKRPKKERNRNAIPKLCVVVVCFMSTNLIYWLRIVGVNDEIY